MSFGKHPTEKLQQIFSQRPFQIQEPEKARIIFLGLDANWDKDIEQNKDYFIENLEYLNDGVRYWKLNGCHTPMLKSFYTGAGEKYHKIFCKLGFGPQDGDSICFLELLKFCTFGNSSENIKLFNEMLFDNQNIEHLNRIKRLSENKTIKICISKGVETKINKLKLFVTTNENIIIHTHFSNAISNNEIEKLKMRLH